MIEGTVEPSTLLLAMRWCQRNPDKFRGTAEKEEVIVGSVVRVTLRARHPGKMQMVLRRGECGSGVSPTCYTRVNLSVPHFFFLGFVPEFDLEVKRKARENSTATEPLSADLLGAQMVGRWKSGAALINAPSKDDPSFDESERLKVNDFEFNEPDPDGVVCPYAAHVRKVYPRDDITPFAASSAAAEVTTQTHRMLRRGISFGPELTDEEAECLDVQKMEKLFLSLA